MHMLDCMQCVYAKYNIFVTTSLPLCSHTVKIDYRNVKKLQLLGLIDPLPGLWLRPPRPPPGPLLVLPRSALALPADQHHISYVAEWGKVMMNKNRTRKSAVQGTTDTAAPECAQFSLYSKQIGLFAAELRPNNDVDISVLDL